MKTSFILGLSALAAASVADAAPRQLLAETIAPYRRVAGSPDPCINLQRHQCELDNRCVYDLTADRSFIHDDYTVKDENLNGSGCRAKDGNDRRRGRRTDQMSCDEFYTKEDCRWARNNNVDRDNGCWWHDCDLNADGNEHCSSVRDTRTCSNLKRSDWNVPQEALDVKCIKFGVNIDSSRRGSYMMLGCDDDDFADNVPHLVYLKQPLTIPFKLEWDSVYKMSCADMGWLAVENPENVQHWDDFAGEMDNWTPGEKGIAVNNWCGELLAWSHTGSDYRRTDDYVDEDYFAPNNGEGVAVADRVRFEWDVTGNGHTFSVWNRDERQWSKVRHRRNPFNDGDMVYLAPITDNDSTVDYDYNDDGLGNDNGAIENLVITEN